jgi:hypothetical protein
MPGTIVSLPMTGFSVIVKIASRSGAPKNMKISAKVLGSALLSSVMALPAAGQAALDTPLSTQDQSQPPAPSTLPAAQLDTSSAHVPNAVEKLFAFKDSDVKFDLRDLMEILRDRRHEGWVLAAYPDPKTGHPLIGAGFSLDLSERSHPQLDPLNLHPFVEPSSAELWQAAGLDSERLQSILTEYDNRMATWTRRGFRKKIKSLTPQITDEDATLLLRVAAIQAIYNARGYCREFDHLTASQQMALSQLVYQMGVNLQQFTQFLDLMNNYSAKIEASAAALSRDDFATDAEYWKTVQQSLVQSQWARLYRARAVAVIAMLDPHYVDEPGIAERRVGAMLRPVVVRRRPDRSVGSRQVSSHAGPASGRLPRPQARRGKLRRQRKQGV